jgi:hypothetical protein
MNAKLITNPEHVPAEPPHCRLLRFTEEGHWHALLNDITTNGTELISDRPVQPGMVLTLVLPTGYRGLPEPRLLRVTHTRLEPASQRRLLSGAFLQALGRDEWEMFRGRRQEPYALIRATAEGPWTATVRSASPRGLELVTGRPFPLGAILTLELPEAGCWGRERLLHVTKVRRNEKAVGWLVGGVLLSRLTNEQLSGLAGSMATG